MILAAFFGSLQRLEFYPGAPLAIDRLPSKLPVVIFSHGLGGYRACYSIPCSELASQGYVVFAIEHADGSASCAQLAGKKGRRFYKGLGGDQGQVDKTRHRVKELKTAYSVLQAMHRGDSLPGLSFSYTSPFSFLFSLSFKNKLQKKDPFTFFKGILDLNCIAAAGHSYGGATAAALVSEDSNFRCGICLDPWWPALYEETAALSEGGWKTKAPLLVMGSHDWNVPNINGEFLCDAKRQAKILTAAKRKEGTGEGGGSGGGALLLVLAGSSHNTFVDPLALFSEHVGWVLRMLGLTARLDPLLGMYLVNISMLSFLSTHLPLTKSQRAAQTWSPASAVHPGLDQISRLDSILTRVDPSAGENGNGLGVSKGMLSWLFPGRGLIYGISDFFMDLVLESSIRKERKKNSAESLPSATDKESSDELDDVVSGTELLESVMPSAEPAAGAHPHAPGRSLVGEHGGGMTLRKRKMDNVGGSSGGGDTGRGGGGTRSVAQLQSLVGARYDERVQEDAVEMYLALLGEEHVYICESHV